MTGGAYKQNRSLIRHWQTALHSIGGHIMSALLESRIDTVANLLRESAAVKQRTIECCTTSILAAAELIAESFRAGGKLLLCGNGGSAADSPIQEYSVSRRVSRRG